MFEQFDTSRRGGRSRLRTWTVVLSLVAHGAAVLGAVVWSFWKIERLTARYVPISFAPASAPPPPPSAAAAPPAPRTPRKVSTPKNHELTQPVVSRTEPANLPESHDPVASDHAVPDGVPGGDPNGSALPGTGDAQVAPSPPADDPPPIKLDSRAVEARRIAGEPHIPLPMPVKQALFAQGVKRLVVPVQLCIGTDGAPSRVTLGRATGFDELDAKIRAEIATWRYSAYRVGASAVPVCTVVVFDYQIE